MSGMRLNSPSVRRWLTCAVVAAALAVPALARAQVVVVANGSPITELDIKQRERLLAHCLLDQRWVAQLGLTQDAMHVVGDRLDVALPPTAA